MALEKYVKKREFDKTPEPKGVIVKKGQSRFVVQEHHASQLHFDFRLEMTESEDSDFVVLKSWAVPKGLPELENQKKLAIQTEDHPVGYIDFEGTIPEGNYGAGTVSVWDSGEYDLIKRDKNVIEFILNGEKAKGRYTLIKTKNFGGKDSWLITKNRPKIM